MIGVIRGLKLSLFGVLLSGLFFSTSCQKPADYLYIHPDHAKVDKEHKVKELVGTSDLDILWVIDDSGSMTAHQATVIANANTFIDNLVKNGSIHWKSGIISTTLSRAPVVGFIPGDELDYSMPDAAQRFKDGVSKLGTSGDSTERMFEPIVKALTNAPHFLRPNALLAIIVVSDAPEQSTMTTATFINSLVQIKGDKSKILFYGFFNPQDWCTPTDDAFMWKGNKFEDAVNQLHGQAYKLCDPLFGKNLGDLGAHLAKQVTAPMILLPDQPIVETIHVFHGKDEVPGGAGGAWAYDVERNAIVFNDLSFAPGDNETVRVAYEIEDGKR